MISRKIPTKTGRRKISPISPVPKPPPPRSSKRSSPIYANARPAELRQAAATHDDLSYYLDPKAPASPSARLPTGNTAALTSSPAWKK